MDFAWPPQRAARLGASVFATFEHLHAIHEDLLHTDGLLMRLIERRAIGNGRRIEDNDIREHSFFEKPAVVEPKICRGQSA